MVDPELLEQLRRAYERSDLQLKDVCAKLAKAGGSFHPDPPALSRKLRGKTGMTFAECQELARVLGSELRWSLRRRARA